MALPLAALAAPSPADGRPLAAEAVQAGYAGDPVAFFGALVDVVLPPLLALLHAGVALEAHGQNTLVVLRGGRPVRLLYRDVGGVRVSAGRLRRPGSIRRRCAATSPPTTRRCCAQAFAAAVAAALAEQVATLDRCFGTGPDPLWARAAATARRGRRRRQGAAAGPLPVKATTAMRLAGDPLDDQWAWLPNPMEGM